MGLSRFFFPMANTSMPTLKTMGDLSPADRRAGLSEKSSPTSGAVGRPLRTPPVAATIRSGVHNTVHHQMRPPLPNHLQPATPPPPLPSTPLHHQMQPTPLQPLLLPSTVSCSLHNPNPSPTLLARLDPRSPTCEDPYYDVPEPLEKPLLEPKNANASSSSTQPVAVTHDISPVSRQSSPPIFAYNPSGWHIQFFIRIDVGGYFHTYPSLGGPFQSLQEAENAIASHLDELRSPMMCTDGLSDAEICIRHGLYWLDGTRKSSSEGNPDHRNVSLLVQALLDKYNEDHHLLGDLAYELDDVVIFREFYEGENLTMFYHINLTTKTKGEDGSHSGINNLFFAEVREIEGEIEGENDEYVLNCLCMVKPTNNGQCYGCMTYGNVDLKHPVDADKYEGGHSTPHKPCCGFDLRCDVITGLDAPAYIEDEEARLMAEEARLRYINMCPADPPVLAKLDGARVPVGLAKRKDSDLTKGECGQGSVKYIVPARRGGLLSIQEYYPIRSLSGDRGAIERSPTLIPVLLASLIPELG
ncbi:hypothetical protein ZWY2020_007337 [Hordeum vulgare]|nr:hypothetical protein ZWY2020_007337 [Hordeum vulgare]